MSFPRYPKYKASGVEWLGEVPEGWEVSKFGYACKLKGGFAFAAGDFGSEGVAVVKMNNLKRGRLDLSEAARIPESSCNESVSLCEGDLIWGMSGSTGETGSLGNFARVHADDLPCQLNQRVGRFKPDSLKLNADLIEYAIQTQYFYQQIMLLVTGTAQFNVSSEQVQSCIFVIPPLAEQTAIANFLDHETAKIDALIAEQQRLIELLKEKRQAVISHAVTKGLNPDAPMKPSGIEWLGDVPEHWAVVPAKRVASVFVPQRNKPELNADGSGHFWVTMEQMRSEEINSAELFVTESAAKDAGTRVLPAGAVVASCVGTFGLAAINNIDIIINQQLQAFIPTNRVDAKFMRHCVVIAHGYFEQIGTAATIAYVNQLGFANMPMVLPPKVEQHEIVAFLTLQLAKFEALTAEAQRAIDHLQERRTALISAAVTGQIDVRGFQPVAA